MKSTDGLCRILSLDGGGAKGFYTLGVLKQIEALAGPLHESFDIVFGTSTGSIIAALNSAPRSCLPWCGIGLAVRLVCSIKMGPATPPPRVTKHPFFAPGPAQSHNQKEENGARMRTYAHIQNLVGEM
jgi:Patatin-like phospholipase